MGSARRCVCVAILQWWDFPGCEVFHPTFVCADAPGLRVSLEWVEQRPLVVASVPACLPFFSSLEGTFEVSQTKRKCCVWSDGRGYGRAERELRFGAFLPFALPLVSACHEILFRNSGWHFVWCPLCFPEISHVRAAFESGDVGGLRWLGSFFFPGC